jgi:nitrogen fixation protein NifB
MTTTVERAGDKDLTAHPCFDDQARLKYSRVHLPVAPACNVQCNFCDRKYDCANESRPGITSVLLRPIQAVRYVQDVCSRDDSLRVVGIAGPGDPLANAAATLETLALVREAFPDMLLCLATNGLALPKHAQTLADLKVSHVTVTVNAVEPAIGSLIYEHVTVGGERLRGVEAAERLLSAQLLGISKLVDYGVVVKINSILIPGVNDHHLPDIARTMSSLGVSRFNCMPLHPVSGTPFGNIAAAAPDKVREVRDACRVFLPQMEHCARCRADAVGRIGHKPSSEQLFLLRTHAGEQRRVERSRVAVASLEGVLVNQHLGEAQEFWVFERRGDGFLQVDKRCAPPEGRGDNRWQELAATLSDCAAVLVLDAGARPRETLEKSSIAVISTEGLIEDLLDAFYQGRPLPKVRTGGFRCGKGSSCGGNGLMCG